MYNRIDYETARWLHRMQMWKIRIDWSVLLVFFPFVRSFTVISLLGLIKLIESTGVALALIIFTPRRGVDDMRLMCSMAIGCVSRQRIRMHIELHTRVRANFVSIIHNL